VKQRQNSFSYFRKPVRGSRGGKKQGSPSVGGGKSIFTPEKAVERAPFLDDDRRKSSSQGG